ncbi:hypothetical protein [Chromobacterium sphagni]|uniref:Uncharacterized protein n=1 Tax=Chromobacterium sphagni TaxID=1903179 RepID=A0A1S1X3N4_9NEIS|nr:hypothetical protein [Chromobacterium sphagni]OHX14089.1 hypothetical protein BI347_11650 [Chromobacterium sphagni]OHX20296.1 hypothetical protein BI344_07350 [Chromobacterium sphagni]
MRLRLFLLPLALCSAQLAAKPLPSYDFALPAKPAAAPRISMEAPAKPLQTKPAMPLPNLDSPAALSPRQQQEMLQRLDKVQSPALPGQTPRAPWDRYQPLPRFDPATGKPRAIPMHELPRLPGR